LTNFLRDRSGAGAAEFAIVALVLGGTMIAIFDMSRVFYEYNQSVKACQEGARFAVVNYLVAPELAAYTATCTGGDPIPQSLIDSDISTNPVVCTCSGISGNPATCGAVSCNDFAGVLGDRQIAFDGIVREMAKIYPRLVTDPDAIIDVAYQVVPGGICGNPAGPDIMALTTVSIGGLQFDFSMPLVGSIADLEFPRCRATLTSEDLSTCGGGVPPYTDITIAGC
jgi:hypothetical protein